MRIHTDKITEIGLRMYLPDGCDLEVSRHGSRSRSYAYEVHMGAEHGSDAHGIKRAYARSSGDYGAEQNPYTRAATWVEWGDWIVALFKIDPDAIIGPYKGAADFVQQTTNYAPHRQAREHAETHAARWAEELKA